MFFKLLIGSSLLGYMISFKKVKRWPAEIIPILVVSLIIIALYGFTYLGYLRFGANLIITLGLGLLVITLYHVIWQRQKITLSSGTMCWLVITLLFSVYASLRYLYIWDDFYEWATLTYFYFFP